MAEVGGYSRHYMLAELLSPLAPGGPNQTWLSQAQQQAMARQNLGLGSGGGISMSTVSTVATAGAGTYTAAQVLGGIIDRDAAGANRADTMPTAKQIVDAIPQAKVGMTFTLCINNTAAGAFTVTPSPGAGGTPEPTTLTAIAQNSLRFYRIRLTNVTAGAEAYVMYELVIA